MTFELLPRGQTLTQPEEMIFFCASGQKSWGNGIQGGLLPPAPSSLSIIIQMKTKQGGKD